MIIFSHPTGNANSRAAVAGIAEAGLLSKFHTSIAAFPNSIIDHLSRIGPLSEIRRRRFNSELKHFTQTSPWREVGRFAASKAGLTNLVRHEIGPFCIDAVYQGIDRKMSYTLKHAVKKQVKAVYSYEDTALFSFRESKRLGLQCIYDLPIGYWRTAHRLLEIEKARWPEWASTLTGFKDSVAKLERKDEELALADIIFVASQFTANTLKDFPGRLGNIQVIPYGFPTVSKMRLNNSRPLNRSLKLLFVGGLSQRKGLANLFAAVEKFGDHIELTIVGGKVNHIITPALDNALSKHRWIPTLPHDEILKLMREHDVLVFPSLFEGFGLVITEAMSQGTPVITTERTAGPDLIEHGRNGWLIEAGSTEAIKETLEELLYKPESIAEAGREAAETASRRPWEVYGREVTDAIKKHLSNLH